jgi:hypothetical protein
MESFLQLPPLDYDTETKQHTHPESLSCHPRSWTTVVYDQKEKTAVKTEETTSGKQKLETHL